MKYKCGVCNGTGHLEFRFSYKNENDIVRILVLECQCDDGWVDWISNIVNESRKELEDHWIERWNLLRAKLTPITKEEYRSNYDIAIENRETDSIKPKIIRNTELVIKLGDII